MNKKNKVGLWSQVALTFFIVSGGAYGLESAIAAIGTFWSVVLILLVPIFWAAPTALLVAELSSAIPESGGYYVWVRRGLGRFWAFQEGWWTICYSAVDLAVYPVLFVTYLSFFVPQLSDTNPDAANLRWGICLIFIFFCLLNNLTGSRSVGMQSLAKFFMVSLPFVILVGAGLFYGEWKNLHAVFSTKITPISPGQLAAGLSIILWNYCGWDNVSTYADEVEEPHKTFPRALFVCKVVIITSYLFPVLIGYKASIDPNVWGNTSGWPEIAKILIGPSLGIATAIAALLSALALFNAQLLYISRLPTAMAKDKLLPEILTKKNKKDVPYISLILAALIAAFFTRWSLGKLMVVDILFYTLGIGLEFFALVALRKKEPQLHRPFKIPLGEYGLYAMSVFPISLGLVVAVSSYNGENAVAQLGIVGAGIVMGLLIYWWKLNFGNLKA